MKKSNLDNKCSLCGKRKDKFTAILSDIHNYILCLTCYPEYNSQDNLGKKWMEKEIMTASQ